jgi:trigger factor
MLEYNLTKINSCSRELEVILKYDEVKPVYQEILNKYIKNSAIPGFRKGKVPLHILMKTYSASIEEDFKEEVVNKFSRKFFEENKQFPLDYIKLTSLDYKENEDMKFKISYDIFPEFELKKYKEIEIQKPFINATDEEVDFEVSRLLEQERSLTPADIAEDDKHVITADIQETDEAGTIVVGKSEKDAKISLNDPAVLPKVRTALINSKIGDKIKISLSEEESQTKQKVSFVVSVKKIEKIVYPELTEDFIQKVTHSPEITTIEALKENLRKKIQAYFDESVNNAFKHNVYDELVKNNPFEVPAVIVNNYLDDLITNMKQQQQKNKNFLASFNDAEYREQHKEHAEFSIKSLMLKTKIVEAEKLSIDDIDLSIYAEKEAARLGMDKEKILGYIKTSEQIKEAILENKFVDFMKENNNIIDTDLKQKTETDKKIITA